MISIEDFTRTVPLGGSGRVILTLSSPSDTPVKSVTADLMGDGEPGWTVETIGDARHVAGVQYRGTKRGLFLLVVTAVDAEGCTGTTGARREVRIP